MKSLWQILTNPMLRAPKWLRLPRRLLSIRASILLVYLIVVGGGFYAIMSSLIQEIQPRYLESMEESLVDTANILAALVERDAEIGGGFPDSIRAVFEKAYARRFEARIYSLQKETVDLRVYVTDASGRAVYDATHPEFVGHDYGRWRDVRLTLAGEYGARSTWVTEGVERFLVLYVAAPVRVDGRIVGVVTVGKPTSYVNELVAAATSRFRVYGIVAAVAILGLGALLSIWLTRPIKQLTGYAMAIRDGRAASYPRLFGIEANELGLAFEEMRAALEGKQYVERYVQSLTHQLKSPLSGIAGAAELLEGEMDELDRQRFVANIRKESERLRRIVDRMLELAAVEARRGLQNVEEIDLGDLAESVLADLSPAFRAEDLCGEIVESDGLTLHGERFLVRQALRNVLENAIDFAPRGSVVEVAIRDGLIEVRDRGPGVPEYALAKVTDRFYSLVRPKTGEKSSGVGLSFVKEIMALHGGSFEIANAPGGGAVARLLFSAQG